MRNFLFGLALALITVQSASAACLDSTFTVTASPYTPAAAGAINEHIGGCLDQTITVRLKYTGGDTLKIIGDILVTNRTGKFTNIFGVGLGDSILTLAENDITQPRLLTVDAGNWTTLTDLGFARKAASPNSIATVLISADSSQIKGCHFWRLDNSSTGTEPLLDIAADSVLVERCLFRTQPDGAGRAIAIRTGSSANLVEIRSNVFYSTGLQLAATGAVHVLANTFAGTRDKYEAIIVGTNVVTPEKNVVIQHNLFAHKGDSLPPIAFSGTLAGSDSILRNAWSRGKANLPLAVSGSSGTTAIILNGASGTNVNTPLPRGFSNYGPASSNVKDYPLTQIRTDATLLRKDPDFGKVFRVFINSNWTTMADVSDLNQNPGKLYFTGFSPFIAGRSYLPGVKVGAFVDQDNVETPNPLDSGAQGTSLKFQPVKDDSTKIKLTLRSFDLNYYKPTSALALAPEFTYYFFSDTLAKLTGANDSTALKTAVKFPNAAIRKPFLGDDSILTVPREVRNQRKDIYVKMLHYRGGQQAPFRSNAGIATVANIPSYPINDLALKVDPAPTSDFTTGRVSITVTRGTEAIDSVMVVTATQGGQPVDSIAKAASGSSINFAFTVRKGTFVFYAVPLAKLGNVRKPGERTPSSAAFSFQISLADTIFVAYKTGGCSGADGTDERPYCGLDTALKDIAVKKGGTIILKNSSPPVALEDITIAPTGTTDTSLVTITNLFTSKYEENRPIFRGKSKEAITITRKNVTLKGFFIEMPVGSLNTAVNVKASGAQIEGNIFRASAKGPVEGLALNVDVGAGDMRFLNNVVWGFTRNVQLTTPGSANIRIINNTFVEDSTFANGGKTTGIQAAGTGAMGAIIANNFFSGIANAIDAPLAALGTPPTLDHNVFTSKQAVSLVNIGDPEPASRMSTPDIWVPGYILVLEGALAGPIECTPLAPCSQLYAGSSTTGYSTTVDRDVFGKPRTNKREVGAFEVGTTTSVMGVLQIDVELGANEKQMKFAVTGKSFDPAGADSVYVFWSTSDLGTVLDPFNSIPAHHRKQYPISKLTAGNFSDFADSITIEAKRYYFYAALGKTAEKSRTLGYKYWDTLTSDTRRDSGDCDLKDTKSACPSLSGRFVSTEGIWAGQFETRVDLTEAVTSGLIKNPRFESITVPNVYNLDLKSPLPKIMFTVTIPGLGVPGSKQMFTADIEMKATPDLTGLDLFLLPADSTGLASYVPSWKVVQTATKTNIIIESSINGTQHYAFGKMQASMEPGIIQTAETTPQVFANWDSTDAHFPVKFKGTGFKTANPLILVTPIPAGSTVSSVLKGGAFPSKTMALSSGFSNLHDSLKSAWLYKYYTKAAGAEAVSTVSGGHKKPFTLDTVKMKEFEGATDLSGGDLTLLGGNLSEATISVPFKPKAHKDYLKYADQIGKTTRSIEVEFTVFDGTKISRSRVFVRTKFTDGDVHFSERFGFKQSTNTVPLWNLYGYPWDDADTGSLARIIEKDKWDADNMRLLRYTGSGNGASDFASYDGTNPGVIKYDAGFASWSGSTGPYTPKVSTGTSLDFETFSLPLAPGQWNDIALPFNFPIKWLDILKESGLEATPPAVWHYNSTVKPPAWEPITTASVLHPWQGYSIKPTAAVTLKFPVLDSSRSGTPLAKAAAQPEDSWTARLEAFNSTALMSLNIGMGSQEAVFPEAPNVPGQDFRVALKRTRSVGEEAVSQYIQPLAGTWQGHWALKASAGQGAKGISLRLSQSSREVPIHLVDVLHKTATPLGKEATVQLTEADLRANDYHIVAGDKNYLDAVMDGLVPLHLLALSNYPNPFAGATLFRYALPESFGKVEFDLKVRDFKGRTVWEKKIRGGSSLSFLWDGRDKLNAPLSAGVYTLSLQAVATGKPVFRATRRLLRM